MLRAFHAVLKSGGVLVGESDRMTLKFIEPAT
jgi:predicted methyltransferase